MPPRSFDEPAELDTISVRPGNARLQSSQPEAKGGQILSTLGSVWGRQLSTFSAAYETVVLVDHDGVPARPPESLPVDIVDRGGLDVWPQELGAEHGLEVEDRRGELERHGTNVAAAQASSFMRFCR